MNDTLTWSLVRAWPEWAFPAFVLNDTTGELYVSPDSAELELLDYENASDIIIEVRATDAGGNIPEAPLSNTLNYVRAPACFGRHAVVIVVVVVVVCCITVREAHCRPCGCWT